ncbi:DNA-directed RNA polymerases II and IV subunit 5A [Porphyridium purpureum]|uniref:DNA-directed RNA polymerases II and IV subunit 5A n=1 Tax=Porphyridium purpureum TaxID=35688 RepID=A0A5J4YSN5_PORPP|nr:DNA-directed RNA polymerases II and IV subunit 5A [Porphyridium purpureum]|eukprot:POR4398..scf236_6
MGDLQEEIKRMFRVRRTVLEMLRDRGYLVLDNEDDLGMPYQTFYNNFRESNFQDQALEIIKWKRSDVNAKVHVFFPQDQKVGVKLVREVCERLELESIHHGIIVLLNSLTPSAKDAVSIMSSQYRLELFAQNELLVNITQHVLVPKHEVLTDDQKRALLEMYKLKESQLPRIQTRDPVARYYGMTVGQVVKVTRPSETAGRYVTYRLVV